MAQIGGNEANAVENLHEQVNPEIVELAPDTPGEPEHDPIALMDFVNRANAAFGGRP